MRLQITGLVAWATMALPVFTSLISAPQVSLSLTPNDED